MEIASSVSTALSSQSLVVAALFTALCFLFALLTVRLLPLPLKLKPAKSDCGGPETQAKKTKKKKEKLCNCSCRCNGVLGVPDSEAVTYLNGGGNPDMLEMTPLVTERQTGASMMEQLVPEITTHTLSYLDYPSLCRLSMTNSLMRKAANDDNAWKALYHKVWFYGYSLKKLSSFESLAVWFLRLRFIQSKLRWVGEKSLGCLGKKNVGLGVVNVSNNLKLLTLHMLLFPGFRC